jgi:hypothetical protein
MDAPAGGFMHGVEKRLWHPASDGFAVCINQKIFFLDPERELSVHPSPLLLSRIVFCNLEFAIPGMSPFRQSGRKWRDANPSTPISG